VPGFEVSTADLNAAQAFVSGLAGEIRTDLGSATTQVESLLDGGWKGTAADGFAAGWQNWHTGALELLDALGRMAALLAVTAREYDGRDAIVSFDFNRLGGEL
jgi:WXG100 family type VII secretion target